MPTPTLTLHAGLSSAQWRVLNALCYADLAGIKVTALVRQQDVPWDQLVDLDGKSRALIRANLAGMPIGLDTLKGPSATRAYLTPRGYHLTSTNPANQVITCLGGKSNYTARVRDLKTEGMADDGLLFRMDEQGLIRVASQGTSPLAVFRQLPRELPIQLTLRGREFFPWGL